MPVADRPANWMPPLFMFSAGVLGGLWLPVSGGMLTPLLLVALGLALGGRVMLRFRKACWWMLAGVLGLAWFTAQSAARLADALPRALEQQPIEISGRVIGVPFVAERYTRFEFAVETLTHNGISYPPPGSVRLYHNQPAPDYRPGQRWHLPVRLKRAHGFQNPGVWFDYETLLFSRNLRATGRVLKPGGMQLAADPGLAGRLTELRRNKAGFINRATGNGEHAALLAALTVGLRAEVDDRKWRVLRHTGTVHLLAISGLHIGLVAGFVGALAAFLWRFQARGMLWCSARSFALGAGLAAGAAYALLAGFSVPTQRALGMLVVAGLVFALAGRPRPLSALLLVLTVLLALDPLAPLERGFWLSFCAVGALLLFISRAIEAPEPKPDSRPKINWLSLTRQWGWTQAVLFIALAPLLLAMFGYLSLVAPLGNLVAIPVIGLAVLPLCLIGLTLWGMGLAWPAGLAYQLAHGVMDYLWPPLGWLADQPWSIWQAQPAVAAVWIALPGLLLLFSRGLLPARRLGLVALLPLIIARPNGLETGEFRYTLLDVGHGLASVVETRNHLLVYDTGPRFSGGFDAGARVLLPYLKRLGAQHIDRLIVSHADNDHRGGHAALIKALPATGILTSDPTALVQPAKRCARGQNWNWDGVEFEIIWPPPGGDWNRNNGSCVLRVRSPHGALLLTGDIEHPAEWAITQSPAGLKAEVLQVPHQGSRTSSTGIFLDAVAPEIALVSTSYLNHYRHPHPEVAARYRARGIHLYDTAVDGALTVDVATAGIKVRSTRAEDRRIWITRFAP